MVSCLLLLCGCHDRKEGGVEPPVRQLEVAFADASEVEFAPGEQRSIPFTVRSTEFAGLEFAAAAAGEDASQWKLSVEQGKAEAASMPCVLKAQAPEKEVKTRLTVTVTAPEGLRREASIAVRVVEPAVPDPEPEPDPGPAAEELSAAGRANCYIISAAGRYMFDATVCGNGSGDGASIALTDDMRADWLWATTGVEATLGDARRGAARCGSRENLPHGRAFRGGQCAGGADRRAGGHPLELAPLVHRTARDGHLRQRPREAGP